MAVLSWLAFIGSGLSLFAGVLTTGLHLVRRAERNAEAAGPPPALHPHLTRDAQRRLMREVMAPLSELIAAAERKAEAEWEEESKPEPDPAGVAAAEMAKLDAELAQALERQEMAKVKERARQEAEQKIAEQNARRQRPGPYIGMAGMLPPDDIRADDPSVLEIENRLIRQELARMAYEPALPSTNAKWNALMTQLQAIEAQIIAHGGTP
jgi:hypothetical protein